MTKTTFRLISVMMVVEVAMLIVANTVTAISGAGGMASEYKHVKCSEAYYYRNVEECDGGVTGGASWHIFKTATNSPKAYWTSPEKKKYTAVSHDRPLSYSYFGAGYIQGSVEASCSTEYYAAYVFDGWGGNNHSDRMAYYGPIAWKSFRATDSREKDPGPDHYPVYHVSGTSYTYSQIVSALMNGDVNLNGWRIAGEQPKLSTRGNWNNIKSESNIQSDAALWLYKFWGNNQFATEIPRGTGWFCITDAIKPKDASSTLSLTVKKNDESETKGPVYVKPGDKLTYHTTYIPNAQSGYSEKAQNISINGGADSPGGVQNYRTIGELFNLYSSWENRFTVSGDAVYYDSGNLGNGDTNKKEAWSDRAVAKSDAGKDFTETAATTSGTPKYYWVGMKAPNYEYILAKVNTGLEDKAYAYVPYNFENSTNITTEPTNDDGTLNVAYAGETKEISFDITTSLRKNSLIGDTYATIVRNAYTRLKICYSEGGCHNSEPKKINDLHVDEDIYDEAVTSDEITINIPDIKAGSEVCIQAGIYPKDSYSDSNTKMDAYNINDDNSWRYSGVKCYTVAKRPSIQFWGGNVYSRANLSTSTAVKNNLAGYSQYPYHATVLSGQSVRAFGSWGELGVVANGSVSGFGSGASMGYGSNNGGLSPNPFGVNTSSNASSPGGSNKSSFCNHIPLTIPNEKCSGNSIGAGLSSAVGITNVASDKEYIVKLLASGESTDNHEHHTSDWKVADIGGIDGSTTKVISSDGNITITSDLDYLSGEYKNYGQMPKLVIYAKKNIYIDCGVSRIDALLIADDTVVTCNNLGDIYGLPASELTKKIEATINNPENSNQLVVNGAIIAKRLIPNRTYGAATGANSIIPAEIVNFDPTLYQFGSSAETDDDTTGRLDITYIHEIAPRI